MEKIGTKIPGSVGHIEFPIVPDRCALLVIDMQNDLCHPEGVYRRIGFDITACQAVIPRIKGLLDAARVRRIPVFYSVSFVREDLVGGGVHVEARPFLKKQGLREGTWGAQIVDELKPQAEDLVIHKNRSTCFYGTNLEIFLKSLGRDTLLVTGVATNVCVEHTIRDAAVRDYRVVLVEDCCAARDEEMHRASVRTIRYAYGMVVGHEDLISSLPSPTPSNRGIP